MADLVETKHPGKDHCEVCSADQRRTDILNAALSAVEIDDKDLDGWDEIRRDAVRIIRKAFDEEILPKGLK